MRRNIDFHTANERGLCHLRMGLQSNDTLCLLPLVRSLALHARQLLCEHAGSTLARRQVAYCNRSLPGL